MVKYFMLQILQNDYIFLLGTGLLGLIVGSFLNVIIYRLPIMLLRESTTPVLNLITPRSHCPKCGSFIPWQQNIPIISYILLKGKCNSCQTIINWHYPTVELLSCLTALLVAAYFGISIKTLAILILTWALIAAIFIDFAYQLLPDNITLPLIWLGLLLNTLNIFTTPTNAIIGAASGYLALWLIAHIFKSIRKIDGMGYGDFKLLAVFGAWLGWQLLPIILFGASLIGSAVGLVLICRKKAQFAQPMPFGPYLAFTGWLAFFVETNILYWYFSIPN